MSATLMQAFLDADAAWSAEGQRVFGKHWGDVRYTTEARGEEGTALRAAYEAYVSAHESWESAGRPLDQSEGEYNRVVQRIREELGS